jgi:hypothetical protein
VESFDNLPEGRYLGSIDKIELRPATDPSKFDQLMVQYIVIDGPLMGRKSSEFLSMSPKAAFRLKRWFDKFGITDDIEALDVDDDTNLLIEPDLQGVNVIFRIRKDGQYQGEDRIRTELVEVVDEIEPAPAPTRKASAKAAPAPVADDEEEMTEDEALAAATATEEEATTAKRRQFQARPAVAGPARRRSIS